MPFIVACQYKKWGCENYLLRIINCKPFKEKWVLESILQEKVLVSEK